MNLFSVSFIVYDPPSGRILRAGSCSNLDLPLQAGPGELVIEGEGFDHTHWVGPEGVPLDRPDSPVTVSNLSPSVGEIIVLNNIPEGTTLSVEGDGEGTYLIGEGETLSFLEVGEYTLLFESFPEKDLTVEVIVS